MVRLFFMLLTIIILGFSNISIANDVVKERMKLFRMGQEDIKALYASIKSDNKEEVKLRAMSLAKWGAKIPSYFPEGSGGGISDASEKIWEDFVSFEKAAKTFELAAIAVVEVAETSDKDSVISAASSVGNSCKSCHLKFKK